jgi:hypothetical protein
MSSQLNKAHQEPLKYLLLDAETIDVSQKNGTHMEKATSSMPPDVVTIDDTLPWQLEIQIH